MNTRGIMAAGLAAAAMLGGVRGWAPPLRRRERPIFARRGEKYPGQRTRYLIGANTSERLAVMPYIPAKT